MMLHGKTANLICYLLLFCVRISGYIGVTQDQTSSRTNTLQDDADDIQKQLDNEARDRIKYGRPKTIWVLHFPTQFPQFHSQTEVLRRVRNSIFLGKKENKNREQNTTPPKCNVSKEWEYNNQNEWSKLYPACKGRSQSPVEIPSRGLIKARGARKLVFDNYDILPKALTLKNDGKRVILYGKWEHKQTPVIYGGVARSRKYLFHCLTLHSPSEHSIGGLKYPLESQVFHISAEYKTLEHALEASPRDSQAFLAIANLYKFGKKTQKGLEHLLNSSHKMGATNVSISVVPLSYFNPSFKEYACYQGSLTAPPCTESVLWLIRGRALTITRETMETAYSLLGSGEEQKNFFRYPQPLNDRKVFLFH